MVMPCSPTLALARTAYRPAMMALLILMLIAPSFAASEEEICKPIKDVSGLPRVLLIGDSISIVYTLQVREAFEGKANVHRIPANSTHTGNVLKNLDQWLGEQSWDVIHINVGLHDVKLRGTQRQISPEEYEKNLKLIMERLKKTKARIIWATTTPIPEETGKRNAGDEIVYNKIAAKVMTEADIAVDDLYSVANKNLKEWQLPRDVHFTAKGNTTLAESVVASITAVLPRASENVQQAPSTASRPAK